MEDLTRVNSPHRPLPVGLFGAHWEDDPSDRADALALRRSRRDTPELRLMLAVLEDAVHTFLRLRHVDSAYARRLVSDAREWIDSNATHPFSFAYICDALNLDAAKLRSGLDATKATGLSARQRMQGRAAMSTEAELDHGTPNPLYAVGKVRTRGKRRCTKCKEPKDVECFSRRSDREGLKSWCKACINARPDRVRTAVA